MKHQNQHHGLQIVCHELCVMKHLNQHHGLQIVCHVLSVDNFRYGKSYDGNFNILIEGFLIGGRNDSHCERLRSRKCCCLVALLVLLIHIFDINSVHIIIFLCSIISIEI